jgi:hypothetical protein
LPRDCLADLFWALIDEENQQRGVGVIERDAFRDCVKQRRLAGARRRDDERALTLPAW